ncbi:hypothetical protein GH742_04930 [Legionella sp. MW5194]|uniref:hypothetical protein n=1 Tax=Legionella sp. MW5194 TaxID=2662448 RepID=UPI00193D74FA|nr:hypothetical protein [Legionella sp. MW5194]QRN03263.1 hypothetical protein GH742_04930 [Legionella sp. MW5194]
MPSSPRPSQRQLNEDLSKQELTAALIIRNQLRAILDDSGSHLKTLAAKGAVNELRERIDQALVALLHAKSREEYALQQKRFNLLLDQFKDVMQLEGDVELALKDFRFFHHVHQTLKLATVENRGTLLERFAEKFQDDPDFDLWCRHLAALQSLPKSQFEAQKKALLDGLVAETTYLDLGNLAAMGLIERNVHLLADTRLAYLKETNNRKSLMKDIGWIGLGIGLVTAAAVLAIAFPVLAVPGIVVGSIVMGYGIIDFAKESVELYSELTEEEKGELSLDVEDELKSLEDDIQDMDVEGFLRKQPYAHHEWSTEKKWVKGLGYAASFAGFALGLVALAFVLPGVAVPAAAVIAVTAVAVGIAALAGAVLGYKVLSEQKKLKEAEQAMQHDMIKDSETLDSVSDHLLCTSLSSDARMNQQLRSSPSKKSALAPADRAANRDEDEDDEREGDEDRGVPAEELDEGDSDTEREGEEEEGGEKPLARK